ncbi:MAG: sigma-70 family RNA polymerase sigma factor [Clostridia bacterium]
MQYYDAKLMMETVGTALPLAILLIEDDEDRQFVTDLYLQHRELLYKKATGFFYNSQSEIEDAVSDAAERMCKYCKEIQNIPCNKRKFYIVKIIRSVCITRLAVLQRQQERNDWFADTETVEGIEDENSAHGIVFSRVYADDLLHSFSMLSDRDKELIRMRHIDRMDYDEIANTLHISEGTARTAVSRAKARLERLAQHVKDDNL